MRCPFCQSTRLNVIDSRDAENGTAIRRRRNCESCNRRFTTYEHIDLHPPKIIKRDNSREDFDGQKIRKSLDLALRKRHVSAEEVDQAFMHIYQHILETEQREVSSRRIGDWVMEVLYDLDAVAFVRFASVYKNFNDVTEFSEVLKSYFSTPSNMTSQK